MSIHRRPGGSQTNVGLLRHALLGGTSLVSTPAFSADFTALTSLPSWLSHSRASNAMVTDSAGKLTYAPNNLLTYSNDFTNAAWAAAAITVSPGVADPFGGNNASTLTATSSSTSFFQHASATTNATVLTSIWVRRRTGTSPVQMYLPDASDSVVISLTSSWQQFYQEKAITGGPWVGLILSASGDAVDVYLGTASCVTYETAPRSADQVITTSAAYYGPRSDFAWNGSAWVPTGLLIEEQRTNLFQWSNDFTNAQWTKASGTVTNGQATGPDGLSSLALWASTGGETRIGVGGPTTASTTYTVSVYAKYVNANGRYLWFRDFYAGSDTCFDTQTGTLVSAPGGVTTSIVPLGGGLYRYSVTIAEPSAAAVVDFQCWVQSSSSTNVSLGVSGGQMYVGFAQREVGSVPTSYIPTTTAAVTRSADIVQLTGAALAALQNASSSAIVEVDGVPTTYGQILGTSSGKALIARDAGSATQIYTQTGDGSQFDATIANTQTTFRAGVSRDGGGMSLVGNGGTVATSATAPESLTGVGVNLGSRDDGFYINSHVRSLAIYTSRLSDADLQAKSVVGAAF